MAHRACCGAATGACRHRFSRPWRRAATWSIGDNQPYSGLREFGFTVQFHAQRPRLPHIMFELRQDEIATTEGALRYADIVHEALRAAAGRLRVSTSCSTATISTVPAA